MHALLARYSLNTTQLLECNSRGDGSASDGVFEQSFMGLVTCCSVVW